MPRARSITMYDDVSVSLIPPTAEAVAGYVNGRFANFPQVQQKFPNAHRLSISVFASGNADCLDIETGDASPAEAPGWVKRQQARGVAKPVVYASLSLMPNVLAELAAAGVPRSSVRVWTAHYTHVAHLCDKRCGFRFNTTADATQWTDKALGRSLDESLCAENFFAAAKPANDPVKVLRWRVRLRHVQALLRDKAVIGEVRAALSKYAAELRALIRKHT